MAYHYTYALARKDKCEGRARKFGLHATAAAVFQESLFVFQVRRAIQLFPLFQSLFVFREEIYL